MTIEREILTAFLGELSKSEYFTAEMVEGVRALVEGEKRPKAEDIAAIFSSRTEPSP